MSERITAPATVAAPPQTTDNRIVSVLVDEIAEYIGGQSSVAARKRAKSSLASAVRMFNTWAWKFNRQQDEITFLSDTSDYPLDLAVRNPLEATLLDQNNREAGTLGFRDYKAFLIEFSHRAGSSQIPTHYTLRNVHQDSLITFHPRIGTGAFSYPKCVIDYHSRITFPSDNAPLGVSQEVEEAIFQMGVALALEKFRSFEEGARARAAAHNLWTDLEAEYRDYPALRRDD